MDLAQAGSTVESKIYDTLQWQIWTLLPGFCTRPTDVATAFKGWHGLWARPSASAQT